MDRSEHRAAESLGGALATLYREMSPRRRRHFYLAVSMMLLGAFAEIVTIGAALPFLAIISDPAAAEKLGAIRFVFDLLDWSSGEDLVLPAILLLGGAAIVTAAVRLLLLWSTQAFVFRFGHELGVRIYGRMLHRPYSWYIARNSAEAIAAMEKVQATIFGVLLPVMQAVVSAVMAVFIIVVLIAIHPGAALVSAVIVALLYVALSFATKERLRSNSRLIADAHKARIQQVQEGLGGIRDILLDRSQPVFVRAFERLDDGLRHAQAVNTFLSGAPRLVIEAAGILLLALLALYMSGRPGGLVAAIPVIGALAIGAQRLLPLLQTIYVAFSRTAGSLQSLTEIAALAALPDAEDGAADGPAPVFRNQITAEEIGFRYPGGRGPALQRVTLTVRKGERIGLIGETGSGKSTLLDLMMGLLEPTEGALRIDGRPLDPAARRGWQAQVAHVPQFIYLADSSIAANIAFGAEAEAIDMERVREAARRAQIAAFVEGLPDGYDTQVGERGVRLSGGQRQRIGIARALYRQAQVLILDEATSALDDETEAAVIEALGAAGGAELTVLMVAHRLTTLAACDRLVRLKDGRIVETGSYAALVGGAARGAG